MKMTTFHSNTNEKGVKILILVKITLRSVNFEMSFCCLQFLPKNERKQVDLRYHSSKVVFVRSFF